MSQRITHLYRPSKVLTVFNQCVVFILAILFFTDLLAYADLKEVTPLNKKHFAFINLGLAGFVWCLDVPNRIKNIKRPIFLWLAFFLLATMVWGFASIALWGTYPEKGVEQFNSNLLTFFYLFSFAILIYEEKSFRLARQLILWITIVNVGINIYDFTSFNIKEFSPIPGRAAGLYYDANNSAMILCFGYLLAVDLVRSSLRLPYTLWLFLGVVITQSRGGIAMFFLLVLYSFASSKYTFKSIVMFSVLSVMIFVSAIPYLLEHHQKDLLKASTSFKNLTERVEIMFSDNSSDRNQDSRVKIFNIYLDLYKENPIVGNGLGAAYANEVKLEDKPISSHNQFLNMMTDFGIVGILLIITFIVALLFSQGTFLFYKEGILFLLLFVFFCFTSHNMFDHASLLFVYCVLGRLLHLKRETILN